MYRKIEMGILKGVQMKQHFHPEIEVLFVIEGEMKVTIQDSVSRLGKEDVVLVNSGIMHKLESTEDTIICVVKFPYPLVAEVLENRNSIFICNSAADIQNSYMEIRKIFHELIFEYIHHTHKTECMRVSLLFGLLDCIIEKYQMPDYVAAMKENEDDVRLQQIFQYVNRNYQQGISLSELAGQLFVSTSTLSRFFKRQTGIYFADYVNQLKCRYAAHDLLYTDKGVTKLALDCGFSNPSVFNKIFRKIYGMAPLDYRKTRLADTSRQDQEKQLKESLRQELKDRESELNPLVSGKKMVVSACVDVRKGSAYEKNWNSVINIGSLYGLTMANVQYHTLYLAEHLGFKYVRLWSVFSQKLMITDGKYIGNYNYDMVDTVLDFLVQNHIYPFLDFGRRPDAVIKSENQPIFFGMENIRFETRRAWEAMFSDFVSHAVKRYGKEEVGHWIFEISYDVFHHEDSRYYQDEHYDQLDVYEYAYHVVKSICPEARVGGPGGVSQWDQKFWDKFLQGCVKRDIVPDFISFILFPYETYCTGDGIKRYRTTREAFEQEQVQMMCDLLREMGMEKCKLYVTECNNTISNRNFLNDSCFRGAYLIKKVSEISDRVDLICPWIGSDWMISYYDTRGIANGGNGFLTKDTVRKPAYFALQFLNFLGDTLIEKSDHYIITRKGQSFYILMFNFKWYSCNYFLGEEGMDSPEKLEGIFENEDPAELEITLKYLPENIRYVMKRRTVNTDHGSLLSEWKKFQYDTQLTGSDIKYIRESCFPEMSMERQTVKNGKLKIKHILQAHEVTIFHIYEENM